VRVPPGRGNPWRCLRALSCSFHISQSAASVVKIMGDVLMEWR
jgi:hypothetical protein